MWKYREASGNSARLNRISAKAPTFGSTPASSTSPDVGDSVYASGSHVCSGTSGTFTANATRNARNNHRPVAIGSARCCSTRRSNVGVPVMDPAWKYRNRIPTNRNADPAIV